MPLSVIPDEDESTSASTISGIARAVLHMQISRFSREKRTVTRSRPKRGMLRRVTFGSIAMLVLVGLAPLAWAAPIDGSSSRGEPAVFAVGTVTVTPTKPSATLAPAAVTATTASSTSTSSTVVRPTATPGPSFVAPSSMSRDAGSSMGSDTIQATTSAPAATTAPQNTAAPPSAPPAVASPAIASATTMACTSLTPGSPISSAGFNAQWRAGEALTPNFWGPAGTGDLTEPYADAPNGQRLVQYFDKGRMERPDANSTSVTNGLLATELITGRIQVGADSFQTRASAAIPLAGDPDNAGPTYAAFGTTAASLLTPAPMQVGTTVSARVAADGTVSSGTTDGAAMTLSSFDAATQHNVPQAFAAYRDRVGLAAIGYAKSEPFLSTVKVGGVSKQVMLQIFERRVLTYTADNAPAFQVEMGNIGQHYYQWRYCGG